MSITWIKPYGINEYWVQREGNIGGRDFGKENFDKTSIIRAIFHFVDDDCDTVKAFQNPMFLLISRKQEIWVTYFCLFSGCVLPSVLLLLVNSFVAVIAFLEWVTSASISTRLRSLFIRVLMKRFLVLDRSVKSIVVYFSNEILASRWTEHLL